jgi:hypothetical protein
LKFKATADLGGLGAKAGPEIAWQWSPPSRLPRFLPAVALLLLLLPKRNRCLQALWVAAPLALSLGLLEALWAIPGVGSDAPDGVFEILLVVPFGLAGVWLLLPYLKARARFVTFLGMLATLELFSLLARPIVQQWEGDSGTQETWIGVMVLGLLLSLTINLAAWRCQGRYDRRRLLAWLAFWIMAAWLIVFTVMSVIEGPGPLLEMATAFLIISAVSFGLLLPFLLLSFANTFYRRRLLACLGLAEGAAGQTITASSSPVLASEISSPGSK